MARSWLLSIQRSPGEAELATSDYGPAHCYDPLDKGDISSDLLNLHLNFHAVAGNYRD
jgi:hypothetical protein